MQYAYTDPAVERAASCRRLIWLAQARDLQLRPDGARKWWSKSGRGTGKTRTAAEDLAHGARSYAGTRWAVVAPTQGDCRDTCFEGESGLLAILDPSEVEHWSRSELSLVLVNGSRFKGFSSEKPDRLRGPQHHGGWLEEFSSWQHAKDTLDNFRFGLRLPLPDGSPNPETLTSTPKRNAITKTVAAELGLIITTESTDANRQNLSASFLESIDVYEGTRLGEQELHGVLLAGEDGALWHDEWFVIGAPKEYSRVAVGWDPAVTESSTSDLHGIVAVGAVKGAPNRPVLAQVLADRSKRATPVEGCREAIRLAKAVGASEVTCEQTQGFDTWKSVWAQAGGQESGLRLNLVNARGSKAERALPVAAQFERGRVEMCPERSDALELLQDECCSWAPEPPAGQRKPDSPNRIDALVHAFRRLGLVTANYGTRRAGSLSRVA